MEDSANKPGYAGRAAAYRGKDKIVYMELLRVIAVVLVIFNHTRTRGYSLYTQTDDVFDWWASLACSIFCKVAVPVFFMISGGVILGRQESFSQIFKKRILRFLIVILLFTFLQYLRIVRVHPENGFHLSTWLLYCYCGNIIEPYWFLKSYLSLLLALPLLNAMASAMKEKDYLLLLGMKALETGISLIYIFSGYMANLSFPFLFDIIFYPLIGYFAANKIQESRLAFLCKRKISSILLLVFWALTTLLAGVYFKMNSTYIEDFHRISVWILAILLFLLIRGIKLNSVFVRKLVIAAGSCTFGVYLIEDVVRNRLQGTADFLSPYIGSFWACMVFVLLVFIIASLVIYLVKKIPFVAKLL